MVSSRKRPAPDSLPVSDTDIHTNHTAEPSLLSRVRSSWHLANLFQWIYLFGRVVKIDDSLGVDDLEAECLKPKSPVLVNIGLCLLKFVSSHRGLTPELFDEYARRQYVAKAPERNPFGTDEVPAKFDDFDALLKLRVLQQLTQWIMLHPERIREKMDEQKPSDQTDWRIEPVGWDGDDRTYYILDDNRLYRSTPAPPVVPAWKPKKNTKKAKAAARAAKRRRTSRHAAQDDNTTSEEHDSDVEEVPKPEDDGFGGAKWECLGVGLEQVQAFLATLRKTRDENEKVLRDTIADHLLPLLEKQEESRKRKALQREKELLSLEKMAHAKRSSRLANKAEQQKLEEQAKQEENRQRREAAAVKQEEQKRLKLEADHDSRARTRDERLREREARRLQHEEELAQLSEGSKGPSKDGRMSQRQRKAEIQKTQQALRELESEGDDWVFDCICGVYGQVDDGTHSVACERCNVWQHSKCLGISEEEADRSDFHFICKSCHRPPPVVRVKITTKPKVPASRSDGAKKPAQHPSPPLEPSQMAGIVIELPRNTADHTKESAASDQVLLQPVTQSITLPTVPTKSAGGRIQNPPPLSPYGSGDGVHAFSSPHPALSPPEQSPNKSRAYSTLHPESLLPTANHRSSSEENRAVQDAVFQSPTRTSPKDMPPHANAPIPTLTARSDSPLKQPFNAASDHLTIASPPTVAPPLSTTPFQTPGPSTQDQIGCTLSTPQLDKSGLGPLDTPSLPPTRNGISPSKRSPPPPQQMSSGVHSSLHSSSPTRAILPPVTALSPSPSEQIMTPPVKHADPSRSGSHQPGSFNSDL
ncbi:hypothetical protein GGR57DRAFT_422000 [Xylariaceae sp. FL1272]|nr:hypothetical protein GGR57DRAFT_422000 [Xylariaceae sp. FL1272]